MKIRFDLPAPLGLMAAAMKALGGAFPQAMMDAGDGGAIVIDDRTQLVYPGDDEPHLLSALVDALENAAVDFVMDVPEDDDPEWRRRINDAAEAAFVIMAGGHRLPREEET